LYKWLEIKRKYEFFNTIKKSYQENVDYVIKKVSSTNKTSNKSNNKLKKYILTPKCAKKICQSTKSKKGNEIREYFIEVEYVLNQYQAYIIEGLKEKQKKLERNQKPKINTDKKILYVFKALNTELTLHKIGKSVNSKKRYDSHNSPMGDDLEILFEYETTRIDQVEKCVKSHLKEFQYRKYKEIFEVNVDIIKMVIRDCDCSITNVTNKIKLSMQSRGYNAKQNEKLYLLIPSDKN
jgi:phage anti-repressor protein